MKIIFKLFTIIAIMTNSTISHAKDDISCIDILNGKKAKNLEVAEKVGIGGLGAGGIGYFATYGGVGAAASLALPVAIVGAAGVVAGGFIISSLKKKQAIKIFEGAKSGGNKATRKVWKKGMRKNPKFFKTITYEQFLQSIHKSNLDRSACLDGKGVGKKGFIKIVMKDVQNSKIVNDSSRSIAKEIDSLPEIKKDDSSVVDK